MFRLIRKCRAPSRMCGVEPGCIRTRSNDRGSGWLLPPAPRYSCETHRSWRDTGSGAQGLRPVAPARSDVLHERAMSEAITAAHALQEDQPGAVLEETRQVQGERATAPEEQSQHRVL